MIDDEFLQFYRASVELKRRYDSVRDEQRGYIERGIKRSYLKNSTDGIASVIEQCEESLRGELAELLKKRDYAGAKRIVDFLAGDSRPVIETKISERAVKRDETPVSYETPLPEELYRDSDSFAKLIENARKLRNNSGENGKLTWRRVSHRAEISEGYIQTIKNGKIPSEKIIKRLAEVLGGDADRFLEIAGRKKR